MESVVMEVLDINVSRMSYSSTNAVTNGLHHKM